MELVDILKTEDDIKGAELLLEFIQYYAVRIKDYLECIRKAELILDDLVKDSEDSAKKIQDALEIVKRQKETRS